MTQKDAENLKVGDTVFLAICSPMMPVQARKTTFTGITKDDPTRCTVEYTGDGTHSIKRVHISESEARADVRELIRQRIAKLLEELKYFN